MWWIVAAISIIVVILIYPCFILSGRISEKEEKNGRT